MMKPAALALCLVVSAGASGCSSGPAPYAPAIGAGPGYTQSEVQPGRYVVGFRGNAKTSDAAVKQMLFFRAAELTVQAGYDAFQVIGEAADVAGGAAAAGDTSFEPTLSRAYAHNIFGYITSQEWSVSAPRVQAHRYAAEIEIVMLKGNVPSGPGVFDARQVIAALQPHIPPS